MKKRYLLLIFLFAFFSCEQDVLLEENNPLQESTSRTKSGNTWDWTTDQYIEMYRAQKSDGKTIRIYNAKTPFYSIHELAEDQDMYPEDGWMLVFKNFGTGTIAPVGGLPSFALYNKYSGILRIMTYIPQELSANYTQLLTTLEYSQTSDKAPLFTFYSDPIESPVTNHDSNTNIFHTSQSFDYQHFWAFSDFVLSGYDPNINNKDIVFDYTISGVDITRGEGEIEGTVEQILSQRKISGFWKFINQLKEGAVTGVSFFKGTKEAINAINKTKSTKESTPSKTKKNAIQRTKVEPVTIIAAASAALGFVKGFINSNKSQIPIKFDADLDVKLKLTKQSSLYKLKIALHPNSLHPVAIKPVQTIPWGVFNLKKIPVYTSNIYEYFRKYRSLPDEKVVKQFVDVNSPEFLSNVEHNPRLGNVQYNVGFIKEYYNGTTSFEGFASISGNTITEYFNNNNLFFYTAPVIKGFAIKVIHRYMHPTEGEKEISIVKTYPIKSGSVNYVRRIRDDNAPVEPEPPYYRE